MAITTENLNQPLVSILMLTYNRAHFIKVAISSVIEQDYQNWELIIIDDGSTDNTETVIKNFSDPRIKYIKHQENAGLFARRQESISYTQGKYTAILDSDDLWIDSTKLSEQVKFLEDNSDHVAVGTFITIISEAGTTIGSKQYAQSDSAIRAKILISNQFTHSSLMFRTKTINQTCGYQPTLAEDLELILQLGKVGKLANLPFLHTAHRVHTKSENDHGVKMATAVKNIIKIHGHYYPNYHLAKIASLLRLSKSYLSNIC